MERSWRRMSLGLILSLLLAAPGAAQGQTLPESEAQITLSFAPLVKATAPAVVNIYTRSVVATQPLSPLFEDPFFKEFFGEDFFGQPRERVENSLGSGVIVKADGLVVTNFHVVAEAQEIKVVLNDGREFDAKPIILDQHTDIALLQLDTRGAALPTLPLGNSDALEVGDLVLAMGNPFGVGQTVTSGIVSAVARTRSGITDYGFFIQTDAAINPGNSGGALVAMDGTLVGINTAIVTRSGGSVGIGFAVPVNMVKAVIEAGETGSAIKRPWIGATGQTVTAELAEGFGLDKPGGVIVNGLYPGGPAERAGLEIGDIIIAINGQAVADPGALRFRLATLPIGSRAAFDLLRDKAPYSLAIDLVAAPETPPRDEQLLDGRHPFAGAKVANLSPALAEELGLPGQWQGVVMMGVARNSPARRTGFRPGDVILELNGEKIATIEDLKRVLATDPDRYRLTFRRGDKVDTVDL